MMVILVWNKIFLMWAPTFLSPHVGVPNPPLYESGEAMSSHGPLSHETGWARCHQQKSRATAITGCPGKLYLVRTQFAFILFLHLHSSGKGKYSNTPEGIWDCDPNMLGVSLCTFGSSLPLSRGLGNRTQFLPLLTFVMRIRQGQDPGMLFSYICLFWTQLEIMWLLQCKTQGFYHEKSNCLEL